MADLVIACVLASVCFHFGDWMEYGDELKETGLMLPIEPYAYIRGFFGGPLQSARYGNFGLASTTLIPTLAYLSILFTLLLSMAVFRMARVLFLQILTLSIETKKSIFFYTGALLGTCVLVGKLAVELRKLFV